MARMTLRPNAVRLNTAMLAIASLILIAMVALAYQEWDRFKVADAAGVRALRVQNAVGDLLSSLLDAETGQRGFLITGKDRYLEPYNRAIQAVPAELTNLNSLLTPPPGQSDLRMANLNALVSQKLAELGETIDLRRKQGIGASMEIVLGDQGKQSMDEIRGICSAVREQAESERREIQTRAVTAARGGLLVTTIGSLILLVLFFVVGNVKINSAIFAREEALTAARNARDSLRTTIDSIADAVISTDAKGRIAFANKAAHSLLQVPETEIAGRHFDDILRIINEFTRSEIESPVTKILQDGAAVGSASDTVLIARDGTEIPIAHRGAPIQSEDGRIQGTVVVFRDITERRHAEGVSRLLASIVESSDDAIISKDLNGIVTSWNKGAERMFGYRAEEMIGRSISVLAAPDRRDEIPEILERIKRGERIDHYETIRRTKSGKLIYVSLTISPVHDSSGRITGASKISRDITARVLAQREVAEQRERLRVTLSSIGDAVLSTDAEGRIVFANMAAQSLLHAAETEITGKPLGDVLKVVTESPRTEVESLVTRVLREGAIVEPAIHTLLLARAGTEIPIEFSGAVLRSNEGQIQGTVLVFRDISERKRMEEVSLQLMARDRNLASEKALRETEAELARVARALTVGELAVSIAHEVNQPLAGVVTNAEASLRWLSGETPNIQEAKESLTRIVRDGNRASAIIRRIREFLRKESQVAESLDVNEIVLEAIGLVRAELEKSDIDLQVQLCPDLPPVRGDRILLQQVVLNLLMNAREAIAAAVEGPRELAVISQRTAEGDALITVRDSGTGIAPSDLGRIFDSFFTTKATGIGMGLSISRSITEAHGGRISAALNDGRGLKVEFTLPARGGLTVAGR